MSGDAPVGVLVKIAKGADPDSDLSSATWTDVTVDVRDTVFYRVGRHGTSDQADAAEIRLRFSNLDGDYSPLNQLGRHWPYLRRNLPLQLLAALGVSTPVEQVTGFIQSYDIGWDRDGDCYVDVVAYGRLQRVTRTQGASASAMRRAITGSAVSYPTAYWPLEDGADAVSGASAIAGVASMKVTGSLQFGGGDGGLGSDPVLDLGAITDESGRPTGLVPVVVGTISSVRVGFMATWPSGGATADVTGLVQISTEGTVASWRVNYSHSAPATQLEIEYMLAGGLGAGFINVVNTTPYDGVPRWYVLELVQSGADILAVLYADGVSVVSGGVSTVTLGRVASVRLNTDNIFGAQLPAIGHVAVWHNVTVPTNVQSASDAYVGENAVARMSRVCDEAGVPFTTPAGLTLVGSYAAAMGAQSSTSLIDNLREAEAADGGLLHDGGPSGYLVYIPRYARYNRPVDLSITGGQIASGARATYDDRDLANDATVSQTGGSSGSYLDQDSDDDEGAYPATWTLNLDDTEDLDQHASWRSAQGDVDELRWPALTLNLRQNSQLVAGWGSGIGVRVVVSSMPLVSPDPIDQLVDGYQATVNAVSWLVAPDTIPFAPWEVIVIDTASSTLFSAVTSTASTMTSAVSRPPRWTTTDVPLRLHCEGEHNIVATAVANVAITHVAEGSASHANNANVTPGLPAGMQAGDLMLIWAAIRNTAATVNVPAGYTRMVGWHNAVLFGKIHSGSESAPTVSFTGGAAGDDTSAQMMAFRGAVSDPATALIDWSDWLSPAAQDIAYPPLRTPKYDGCLVLYLGWKQDDWTIVSTIAGATEAIDAFTLTGNDQGICADWVIQTSAAAIASSSFTVTGGVTAISRGMVACIAPGQSTLTVTRATDGTAAAHAAGASLRAADSTSPGL